LFSNKLLSFDATSFDQNISLFFSDFASQRFSGGSIGGVNESDRSYSKDYNRIFLNGFTQALRENPYKLKQFVTIGYSSLTSGFTCNSAIVNYSCNSSGNNDIFSSRSGVDKNSVNYLWSDLTSKFGLNLRCSFDATYHHSLTHPWVYGAQRSGEFKVVDRPVSESCCPLDKCWNGYNCVNSVSRLPGFGQPLSTVSGKLGSQYEWYSNLFGKNNPSGYDMYVCHTNNLGANVASWVGAYYKERWDNTTNRGDSGVGYCLLDTQCWTGYFCINNTQYIDESGDWPVLGTGDHYCQNGSWTSRTKLVALSILNLSVSVRGSLYNLYCNNSIDGISSDNSLCLYRNTTSVFDYYISTPVVLSSNNLTYQTNDGTIIVGVALDSVSGKSDAELINDFFTTRLGLVLGASVTGTTGNLFEGVSLSDSSGVVKGVAWNSAAKLLLFSNKLISYSSISSFNQSIDNTFTGFASQKNLAGTFGSVSVAMRNYTKDYNRIFLNLFTQALRENPYNVQEFVDVYYSDLANVDVSGCSGCITADVNHTFITVSSFRDGVWGDLGSKFGKNIQCSFSKSYHTSLVDPWKYSSYRSGEFRLLSKPISESCCPNDKCWNGSVCVSGAPEPFTGFVNNYYPKYSNLFGNDNLSGYDMYVCYLDTEAYYGAGLSLNNNASWVGAYYKEVWDNSSQGYCLNDSDCWSGRECVPNGWYTEFNSVERLPTSLDPSVVTNFNAQGFDDSGFKVADHFCEKGNWSSRTKLLALRLLNFTRAVSALNYTLYCDTPANSLVNLSVFATVPGANTNNFCVLTYEQTQSFISSPEDQTIVKSVVGFSLNNNISSTLYTLLGEGVDSCSLSDVSGSIYGKFERCGNDRLFYDARDKLVIYSYDAITNVDGVNSLTDASFLDSFIRNPFSTVINFVLGVFTPSVPAASLSFAGLTKDFDRVYLAKFGSKEIFGYLERTLLDKNYLSVSYKDFSSDLCSVMNNAYKSSASVNCVSNLTISRTDVFVNDSQINLNEYWRDLTARTRIRVVG